MTFPSPPDKIVPFGGEKIAPYDIGRQFDEHTRAFKQVIDFLHSVVRDDGALRNGSVGPEQLDPQLAETLAAKAMSAVEDLILEVGTRAAEAQAAAYETSLLRDKLAEYQRTLSYAMMEMSAERNQIQKRLADVEARPLAGPFAPQVNPVNEMTVVDDTASGAEAWSHVSKEWAEHMPDTIPPNILAMEAITGEHWSARWWAKKAMDGVGGGILQWYMGAWPDPGPPTTPYTENGDPIPPGELYFNTTHNVMMVWNGTAWQNMFNAQRAVTATLYYHATAGQTVFNVGTVQDAYGHTYAFPASYAGSIGVIVFLAGDRVEPTAYTVDPANSKITLTVAATAGEVVIFDFLDPMMEFLAGITLLDFSPAPNGTNTVFNLVTHVGATPAAIVRSEDVEVSVDGVTQEPIISYSAYSNQITFVDAPRADSVLWIVWFGPTVGGSGGTGGGGGSGTPSDAPPLMDGVGAPGTLATYARGDHRHPTDTALLKLTGGTLTGALILAADPGVALGAATKQYVDAHTGGLTDAPSDGSYYSRRNAAWAVSPAGIADVPNDSIYYVRRNSAWTALPAPTIGYPQLPVEVQQVPICFVLAGKPAAGLIINVPVTMAMTIASAIAGTQIYAGTAATGNPSFTLNKISGGVTSAIGAIAVTAGSHTACTLSGPGGSVAIGDTLQILAPAADATLADLGVTILAMRV